MEAKLRHALEKDEFRLFYQPKVDLETGKIHSVEALLRWNDPDEGMISPAEFIPVLEETGLIVPVGEWIISQACKDISSWSREHNIDTGVAINISPLQLRDPGFCETLKRLISENNVSPSRIECEMTESTLLNNTKENINKLNQLKELGVKIAIDDFGTGYSSLSYLVTLPIDTLKIDQSFVRDMTTQSGSAAIVKTVINLAHNLGLEVVAEGVENKSHVGFLQQHGCDIVQGYYISKPVPSNELIKFLKSYSSEINQVFKHDSDRVVLFVDDDPTLISLLQRVFKDEGYLVLTSNDAAGAFELLATHDVGVIVSDQRMPHMSGTEFLHRVKDIYPHTMRIILSGYSEMSDVVDAVNQGSIYKFITKPWRAEQLKNVIREAFKVHEQTLKPLID
jgi:EAL domain-containing protein (putative c-di-GMP-specific phosphodiesterase class I)/CheY-like chemotaxis protein